MLSLVDHITQCAAKLSLNILRDGTQSAEGNRLRHSDIQDIAAKIDQYMQHLPEYSKTNLIHLMKTFVQRGFGYMPLCIEDQKMILDTVCFMGIKHFRIFDMMNDARNLSASVNILKNLSENNTIELAICVNSERGSAKILRDKHYYQHIIAEYLLLEPHKLAIKDYAGLCDYNELYDIVTFIRAQNPLIPIAIHAHKEKSDILAKLLFNGIHSVDVGMSAWAGGNAHSDYFKVIYQYLQLQGYDIHNPDIITQIEGHFLIKKAREIETLCDLMAPPYKALRTPIDKLPSEDIVFKAKIAAGGIVAMRDMLKQNLASIQQSQPEKSVFSEALLMEKALEKMALLWDQAGRPDTVTPGSLILSKTANILAFQEFIYNKPISLKDIPQDYKDIVMGRYGKNWGFDAGFGCLKTRYLFLLEAGFKVLKDYLLQNEVLNTEFQNFTHHHKIPDLYDIQHMALNNVLQFSSSWWKNIVYWLENIPINLSNILLKSFHPQVFSTPKSLIKIAKQEIKNLPLSINIRHIYPEYDLNESLQQRIVCLFLSVKSAHIKNMLQFRLSGIISGSIEADPRAVFWRDTICVGNVNTAYYDLVSLMQFYPPGRMTKSNATLRARKRRTLSLKMTEIGIENNFQKRSNINNIYHVHRLTAKNIITAKRNLATALTQCIVHHNDYHSYKQRIIDIVTKQAIFDAINLQKLYAA